MSGNLHGFDASQVKPNDVFEALPAGEYEVCIIDSQVKPTSSGTGKYLELSLQVVSGQYQNRRLIDRLNLWNQNPKAQEIARGTLSSICRAVGVLTPEYSSDLHNKTLRCKVKVRTSEEYGDQNEVKGYKPRAAGPVQPSLPPVPPPVAHANTLETVATPW